MTHATADHHLVRTVTVGSTTFTLLGTAHVSPQSVADVRREIDSGQYDAVAVELCDSRYHALTNPRAMEEMDLFQVIRDGKAGMVAASLALGAYQQRLAEQFQIRPGAEMEAAIRGAEADGLPLFLVDREIGITLKRIYRRTPWWQRMMLASGLLASLFSRDRIDAEEIERLKEGDILESTFSEFADRSRVLYETLIHERDRFMAARLLTETREHGPSRVLAVVGAGHLAGLEAALREGIDAPQAELERLNYTPPRGRWLRLIPWVVVALVLTGFAIGFSRSTDLGVQLVLDWVLINGALSALGAAIALAHPLTVLTAFVAAPLTSLNPTVGAGMVTAGAEMWLRKPQVRDFRSLRGDVTRLRGWWRNRVSRTLLIFLMSTLGSAAGTYLAGFRIAGKLIG
ncbi:TraB/GumN family protein [Arhodomonas sp. SL1]|uniref:TraB/GumN family protein n=1 Tax=Arhodomonas sp. SL1 TaxID=3425691 RepID=UPI003F880BE6